MNLKEFIKLCPMTVSNGMAPITKPSKTQLLGEKLFEMCMKAGPSAQLPSFRDLCRSFEVSKTTLDNALSELEQRRMIVRHHGKGIYTSPSVGQRTVGVVLGGDIFSAAYSPYWRLLLQAAKEQLIEAGMRFHAYFDLPSGDDATATHQQLEEDLRAKRLDGLLLIARQSEEEVAWMEKWDIPLVVLPSNKAWGVASAPFYDKAILELAQRGCKRVVWMGLGSEPTLQPIGDAMGKAGLPSGQDQFWTSSLILTWSSREELARRIMDRMWAAASPPVDGLILDDDTMTKAVVDTLERQGLTVGRDVMIATAANKGSPVLQDIASKLILFENDPKLLAHAAMEMLETLMKGKHPRTPVEFLETAMTVGSDVAQTLVRRA